MKAKDTKDTPRTGSQVRISRWLWIFSVAVGLAVITRQEHTAARLREENTRLQQTSIPQETRKGVIFWFNVTTRSWPH